MTRLHRGRTAVSIRCGCHPRAVSANVDTGMQRYLEALSGVSALTRSSAERTMRLLVRQGDVATDQVGEVVHGLRERSRRNREAISLLVAAEVQRVVRSMGLATNDEVLSLRKQVADLKREVAQVTRDRTAS